MVLLYVPSICYWIKNYCPYLRYYGILALPAVYFAAYIICLVCSMFLKRTRPFIKGSILVLLYVLIVIESYIIIYFGTRFSPTIIAMILETNASEASGFVRQYLLSLISYKFILVLTIFTIVFVFVYKKGTFANSKYCRNKIINVILCSVTIASLFLGVYKVGREALWHKYNIDEIGRVRKYSFYSTIYLTTYTLYDALRLYYLSLRDIPTLVESLSNTSLKSCKFSSPNIILVIGESFNKHHSSLYGYPLLTNPLLESEDNLYIMTDVITADRSTSIVMKSVFSFRTKDNNIYWANSTLFPALFKKAGYYNTLISNQEVENVKFADVFEMANNYLIHPDTKAYLWSWTNSMTYQYDMQLIDEYADAIPQDKRHTLTIFHLLGQHAAYVDRYPKECQYFTEEDYKFRLDLSPQQKRFVAEYDNAVRYGDAVLKSIIDLYRDDDAIVIFFSDHGEEIYDYRDYMGRSHEPIITSDMAKCVFEVPFFIWVSDKYKQAHPDIVGRIENSINKPYVIDDVPHLLLDLAGIQCDEFEPSRSLISNEEYNFPRLVHESMQDYAKLQ